MANRLRFPRLPVNWKDQPQLFERYWDITMNTLEDLITTTGITTQITGGGTTTVTGSYPVFNISSADQYVGTVTSINVSGGTTGLTFSGGPVTSSGTITLGGTLSVANGGTGTTTSTGTGSLVLSIGPTLTGTTSVAELAGILYIPAESVPPTHTPSSIPGHVTMYYDTTADELYVYNGSWKKIALA